MRAGSALLRLLPVGIAACVVGAAGVVHGDRTGRWEAAASTDFVRALDRVPLAAGDWRGSDLEGGLGELARGTEKAGYVVRSYQNARTGQAVSVMFMYGRPGPVATHVPEACYTASGHEIAAPRARVPIDRRDDFWRVGFRKLEAGGERSLDVYYAWTATGDWHAPDVDARLTFARASTLHKMYVVTEGEGPGGDDAAVRFLEAFLPVMRDVYFDAGARG